MPAPLVLDRFLPYRLAYTSNLVSEAVARTYKALFGLTIPEWRLVAHVAERPGVTQQDVVMRSRMDKVAVSRAAVSLVDRGLIRREPNAADGRSQILALTGAGQELYAAVAPKAMELEEAIFGAFSPAELVRLTAMLRHIDEATERLLARGGEGQPASPRDDGAPT